MVIFRQNNCRQKKADHYSINNDRLFSVCKHSMGLKKLLYSIIIINIKKNASVVRKRVSDFQKNFLKHTGNRMVTGCQ